MNSVLKNGSREKLKLLESPSSCKTIQFIRSEQTGFPLSFAAGGLQLRWSCGTVHAQTGCTTETWSWAQLLFVIILNISPLIIINIEPPQHHHIKIINGITVHPRNWKSPGLFNTMGTVHAYLRALGIACHAPELASMFPQLQSRFMKWC